MAQSKSSARINEKQEPTASREPQQRPAVNECPQCNGVMWRVISVPDKFDASRRSEIAIRCECYYEKRKTKLLRAARIPERYAGGFEDYQTDFPGSNQSLEFAKMIAMDMVKEYPVNKTGLMLVGPLGVGKTHLACAVLRNLILNGVPGLFYSYADLLTEIRNTYNANGALKYFKDENGNRWETESQILNHVINVEVLLLDELGKVKASEWVLDKVREIIGGRYDRKRTTLVTTNFPIDPKIIHGRPKEIPLRDKIGADMVSRLREMCRLVEMDGPDFRHNQKAVNRPDNGR
jgi:DNA replication protein DnaC